MIAIREIHDVKSGKVTIKLPQNFDAKRVEIIVLPVDDSDGNSEDASQGLRDLLLTAPVLSEEEADEYVKVREWMNEWRVKDF